MIWLAGLSACGYLALALAGDLKRGAGTFLLIHAILFAVFLAAAARVRAVRRDAETFSLAPVVWSALVFRLLLLPAAPSLSDDIYRYVWEGRLQLHGVNPYAQPPSDPRLEPLRDEIYERINYKDLPAIYPPAAQWTFALVALVARTPQAMKTPMVAADMALVLLLGALLRARGLPPARVLLYAWNPLVVVEVAGSGHMDTLGTCTLVASTIAIIGERPLLSMTALAVSAMSKLYPITLLPLYASRARPRHLLVPPLLLAAAYLPYASAGGSLIRSPRAYAERWRSNDGAFAVLVSAVDATGISPVAKAWADARGQPSLYTQPHMLARLLAALVAMAALAYLTARVRSGGLTLERGIFLFTGTVLIMQPTLHPWYLLWILPWTVLFPSPAWIALSALAPLAYLGVGWAPWAEHVPFFALLIGSAAMRRWRRIGMIESTDSERRPPA